MRSALKLIILAINRSAEGVGFAWLSSMEVRTGNSANTSDSWGFVIFSSGIYQTGVGLHLVGELASFVYCSSRSC